MAANSKKSTKKVTGYEIKVKTIPISAALMPVAFSLLTVRH